MSRTGTRVAFAATLVMTAVVPSIARGEGTPTAISGPRTMTTSDGVQYERVDGRWRMVARLPPVEAGPADGVATSTRVDADRDKIVDTLEVTMANTSAPIPVIVVSRTADGESVVPLVLEPRRIGDIVRSDRVLSVWPDAVVNVPEDSSAETTTRTIGYPEIYPQPEDTVRGLADLRTSAGTDGGGVDVAVIDTGVDSRHSSLSGRVVHREEFVSDDSSCGESDPGIGDATGHGTHVAGIIAGSGTVRGVAPGARIVGLRVLSCDGSGSTSDILAAIDWVIAHKDDPVLGLRIRVANLSLGAFACYTVFDGTDPLSVAVNRLAANGVTAVVAAGNSAGGGCGDLGTVGAPGAARYAITVGASIPEVIGGVGLALFSSRGLYEQTRVKPDVVAPGVNISSARSDRSVTDPDAVLDGVVAMSGTSMATPFVAGLAALALDADPSLASSGSECPVETCPDGVIAESMDVPLLRTAHDTALDRGPDGPDVAWGWGMVEPKGWLDRSGSSYPTRAATAFESRASTNRFHARLRVSSSGPVSVSLAPVVTTLSASEISRDSRTAFSRATLTRVSDGEVFVLLPSFFYSSGWIFRSLLGRSWCSGSEALAPGIYDFDVHSTGFDGTIVLDGSNIDLAVPSSSLFTLSASSMTARPGASATTATIRNGFDSDVDADVIDTSGVAVIVPSRIHIPAGGSTDVAVSTPAATTRSGISLRATVVSSDSPTLVGISSDPLVLVAWAGPYGESAADLPRIQRVSENPDGTGVGQTPRQFVAPGEGIEVSDDGRFAAFWSEATVSTTDGTTPVSGSPHVYLRDRIAGTTSLVGGVSAESHPARVWDVSSDGTRVLFSTDASLQAGDTNGCWDVYEWTRTTGNSVRISRPNEGIAPCEPAWFAYHMAAYSPDESEVAWSSAKRYTSDASDWVTTFDQNVYVTPAGAGMTRLLTAPTDGVRDASEGIWYQRIRWSNDGNKVVFLSRDRDLFPSAATTSDFIAIADLESGSVTSAIEDPDSARIRVTPFQLFGMSDDVIVIPGIDRLRFNYGLVWRVPLADLSLGSATSLPLGTSADVHGKGPGGTVLVGLRHAYADDEGWCGLFDPVSGATTVLRDELDASLTTTDCSGAYLTEAVGAVAGIHTASALTVNDSDDAQDVYVARLTGLEPLRLLTVALDPTGTAYFGRQMTAAIVASGAVGRVTYSFEDGRIASQLEGSVPEWLTINPSTGRLAGTAPTRGTYRITVLATDSTRRRTQALVDLIVQDPPAEPPGVPKNLVPTAGNGRVTLSWSPPDSPGEAPIDAYVVESSTDGRTWRTLTDAAPLTRTWTVTGLTNGVWYRFRVGAVSAVGRGPASSEVRARPLTVASPPLRPATRAASRRVTVSWSAPSSTGGAAVVGYRLQISRDARTWTTVTSSAPLSRTWTVTGLTNGVTYRFRVAAVTVAGIGSFSVVVSARPR